jgi:hypothetical protein
LAVIPFSPDLPELGEIEFVVLGGEEEGSPAAALAASLLQDVDRLSAAADNLPAG